MIDEIFEKFDGAFAENTMRAYRSDFEMYLKWCFAKNVMPIPATAYDLARYVDELSQTCKSATIRRKINSLGTIFRLSKNPDPSKDPEVVLAMKRMHRKIGRHQKQARPLLRHNLEHLLSNCSDDLRGLRNRVLLQLGHETMRRGSELCALKFDDLEIKHEFTPVLHLRTSKTDQEATGLAMPISRKLSDLIHAWKIAIGAQGGYILRAIDKHGNVSPKLSTGALSLILNSITCDGHCGTEPKFSSLSFRLGGAITLFTEGLTFEEIMLLGGWRSDASLMRYLKQLDCYQLYSKR